MDAQEAVRVFWKVVTVPHIAVLLFSLILAMIPKVSVAMMYRPSPDFRLWDTWIFVAEDEFHLFFSQRPAGDRYDSVGHAVSTDLLHWKSLGPIIQRGPEAWPPRFAAGMVIQNNDQYMMFQAARAGVDGGEPGIGVMLSSDLHEWTKHPKDPVMKIRPPYVKGRAGDPYLFKVDNGYEAVINTRISESIRCIGWMRSKDLIHWEVLRPIATPEVSQCEVPEYFQMGDKHYLTFSACGGRPGCIKSDLVIDTRSRKDTAGTYYLISDSRTGPYVMPEDSLLIGSGNGRIDCYVGRTFELKGQRMLYYHNVGLRPGGCDPVQSRASLAAPKVVRRNEDGSLWLQYWNGLAGLETGIVLDKVSGGAQKGTDWEIEGEVLFGRRDREISFYILPPVASDFNLTCDVNVEKGNRAAVIFRYDEETQKATALILDTRSGNIEIARMDAGQLTILDTEISELEPGEKHRIRIFARSEFVDSYVDDRLIFSTAINDVPLSGKIGFAVDSAVVSFWNLRVASLEELQ